jgi:hypothetical protein
MSTSPVKSSTDEQVDEAKAAQVRNQAEGPAMRVADLPYRINARWLRRRTAAQPQ